MPLALSSWRKRVRRAAEKADERRGLYRCHPCREAQPSGPRQHPSLQWAPLLAVFLGSLRNQSPPLASSASESSEVDNSCFLCARDGLWCLTIISYKSPNSLRRKCLLWRILRVLGPRFRNGKIRIQTCACLPLKPTPFLCFQIPQPNSAFSAF